MHGRHVINLQVDGLPLPTDVTSADQAKNLIERAVGKFGRVDVLVNNAGGAMPGRLSSSMWMSTAPCWSSTVFAPLRTTPKERAACSRGPSLLTSCVLGACDLFPRGPVACDRCGGEEPVLLAVDVVAQQVEL
jgi:hypothetical protein